MASLTLQDPTAANLIAMADGLMRVGQVRMAEELYAVALKTAGPAERKRLLVRHGLAASRTKRAKDLHGALLALETLADEVFVGEGLATWLKTTPFLEDPRFVALASKHADLLPIANWHWNLQTVLWAARQALKLDGEFMELGVFKGHTTLFVAEYLEFQDIEKRWRLYDTFDGIPDDQLDPGWKEMNRNAYGDTFSYDEVKARFSAFSNIEVIKGRVPEILAENCPDRIAFLHMDLNNSTAEIQALDALFDRIVPGGLIIFDDYGWGSARAQHDAENRWFAARGLEILALPTGQGLFIKSR